MTPAAHTPGYARRILGLLTATTYVAAVLAANWTTAHLGFVSVGFGLAATAGTYAAGATFLLRDLIQDALGRRAVFGAIVAGAALSAAVAPAQLALASGVTFLISEAADFAVYTPLRRRGWARAVLASNLVGAVIDTLVFLSAAGFPLTVQVVGGQLIGKIVWATVLPVAVVAGLRRLRPARPEVVAE
jgi:uncharacterized PurR-regulated membrane protein YhhQ (DUF165 family)